jgi:hypothetical protein
MTGTEKKKIFAIFGHMTMTKEVYDYGLIPIRGFYQRATF